jgi:hypothetical protein
MQTIAVLQEALKITAILLSFVTAVLLLALADLGMTLLLIRGSKVINKAAELPEPEIAESSQLPSDHRIVIGGGIVKWE